MATKYDKKQALIVMVDNYLNVKYPNQTTYEHSNYKHASDALAIAEEKLRGLGFDVGIRKNPTGIGLKAKLKSLEADMVEQQILQSPSLFVIYYIGAAYHAKEHSYAVMGAKEQNDENRYVPIEEQINFFTTTSQFSDVIVVFDGPRCRGPNHINTIENTLPEQEKSSITYGSKAYGDRCDSTYEPIAGRFFDMLVSQSKDNLVNYKEAVQTLEGVDTKYSKGLKDIVLDVGGLVKEYEKEQENEQKIKKEQEEEAAAELARKNYVPDKATQQIQQQTDELRQAQKQLEEASEKELSEVRSLASTPQAVSRILQSLALALGTSGSLIAAKKEMDEPEFVQSLINLDPVKLDEDILIKIEAFVKKPEFQPGKVDNKFKIVPKFCSWILAFAKLGRTLRDNNKCYDQIQANGDADSGTEQGQQKKQLAPEELIDLLQAQNSEFLLAKKQLKRASQTELSQLEHYTFSLDPVYDSPIEAVETIMKSIAVALGKNGTFEQAKQELANPKFLKTLIGLDPINLDEQTLKKIEVFTNKSEFEPKNISQKLNIVPKFCSWVLAFSKIARTLRDNKLCQGQGQQEDKDNQDQMPSIFDNRNMNLSLDQILSNNGSYIRQNSKYQGGPFSQRNFSTQSDKNISSFSKTFTNFKYSTMKIDAERMRSIENANSVSNYLRAGPNKKKINYTKFVGIDGRPQIINQNYLIHQGQSPQNQVTRDYQAQSFFNANQKVAQTTKSRTTSVNIRNMNNQSYKQQDQKPHTRSTSPQRKTQVNAQKNSAIPAIQQRPKVPVIMNHENEQMQQVSISIKGKRNNMLPALDQKVQAKHELNKTTQNN